MFEINGKIFRNIQEQVQKNKSDIAAFRNVEMVLNQFGITVLGRLNSEDSIPEQDYNYGDAWLIGEETPYDLYIYTRTDEEDEGEFINIGPVSQVGPMGPAGEIEIGTVTTGETGTPASVVNVGTEQHAILNFTLPKGNTGNTGSQGIQGIQGPIGLTPSLSIGTVETGAAGSSASVSISGTTLEPVLNFTIPQGSQGIQGDPGQSFIIIATINNTSQLPDPSETPRNHAYVYIDGDSTTPDRMYFITGSAGSETWSYASFAQVGTTVTVNNSPVSTFNADNKQDKIDSLNKLSADLVDDSTTTNKFVTGTDLTAIGTIGDKLNKISTSSTYNEAYCKASDGTQTMVPYTTGANASHIVQRDANSQITVPSTPTANGHAASKEYVDTEVGKKLDYKTSGATYGLVIPTTTSWTSSKTVATTSDVNAKLDATKCTFQTTEPTSNIYDNGVHIVYLSSEPSTYYNGYIYLIYEA